MINHKSLTIALTYDLKSDYDPDDPYVPHEALAEFAEKETITIISDAMQALGHVPIRVGNIEHLVEALAAWKHRKWDGVQHCRGIAWFSEGRSDSKSAEAYTVSCTLRRKSNVPHARQGFDEYGARDAGLRTAPFILVKSGDTFNGFDHTQWLSKLGLEKNSDSESFDLFIKLNAEGTSKGLIETSRARDSEAANRAVQGLRKRFPCKDILVGEYLDGREFSVSLAGTGSEVVILRVTEMLWPAGSPPFCTWFSRIDGVEGKDWAERAVRGCNDDEVVKVESLALQAWSAMGCRDGGRIDIRSRVGDLMLSRTS